MGKLVTITKTISILVDEENALLMEEWLDEYTNRLEEEAEMAEEDISEDGSLVKVDWDTDDEPVEDLPEIVRVPSYVEEGEVADWLSDCYGYCVNSYSEI